MLLLLYVNVLQMLKLIVDARSEPEELNKKAVTIINRVRDKLTGFYHLKKTS